MALCSVCGGVESRSSSTPRDLSARASLSLSLSLSTRQRLPLAPPRLRVRLYEAWLATSRAAYSAARGGSAAASRGSVTQKRRATCDEGRRLRMPCTSRPSLR